MAEKVSHLIRSIAACLHKYVNDRRRVLRRGARFEARLPFIISLLGTEIDSAESLPHAPALVGYTRDLSETGLTLLLPSVRIGGIYLTNKDNYLGIRLELPSGPVALLTVSVRFEQLPHKEAGCGYLLGVRIIKMQNDVRDRYIAYLSTLEGKERRVREQRRVPAAALIGPNGAAQMGRWEALTPTSVSKAFEKFLREPTYPRKP